MTDAAPRDRLDALLDRLAALPVDGPSRGGPHVGIAHNDLTRDILACGPDIVPRLIARLPTSGYDEAVHLVFLLREARAVEAKDAILALRSGVDARSVGRDLTLAMQIAYYLRDVAS